MIAALWPVIVAMVGGIGIGLSIALPVIDRRARRAHAAIHHAWSKPNRHRAQERDRP